MVKINEKFWVGIPDTFVFKESKNPSTGERKFIMRGMMMPKGKVSRNGVLYDWDSVKEKHNLLEGKPLMFNHQIDGRNDVPFGHFTKSEIIEDERAIPIGFENVYKGPGWYYESDIDPEEKDMIRKLQRGDLRHVSIQLMGDSVNEKYSEELGNYQEATVGDIIEGSVVSSPGFLDTSTEVFAEAFGKKEDVTTTTADGAVQPTQSLNKKKEAVSPCEKWLKSLDHAPTDGEVHKWAEENGQDVHQVEAQIYKLAKAHVDNHMEMVEPAKESFKELKVGDKIKINSNIPHWGGLKGVVRSIQPNGVIDVSLDNGKGNLFDSNQLKKEMVEPAKESDVDPKQLQMGIEVEMEHTDDKEEAKTIALQHLAEVSDYYTKLGKYVENKERVGAQPTQPLMEDDEANDVIKELNDVDEKVADKIIEEVFKSLN